MRGFTRTIRPQHHQKQGMYTYYGVEEQVHWCGYGDLLVKFKIVTVVVIIIVVVAFTFKSTGVTRRTIR